MDITTENISYTIKQDGKALIQIETSVKNAQTIFEKWRNKICLIEFGKKLKRSLNANSYYWSLVNQLADCLNISKEEVHFDMLKHYSQRETVFIRSDIDIKGFFQYYEKIGESSIDGKAFTHYRIYKGSREMNSKEMWVLIKGIESECIPQGIPILEDIKLERLIKAHKKHFTA